MRKQGETSTNLRLTHCRRLALSHNPSLVIPHSIALCSRLFYLNLRWNDLTTFPEAVSHIPVYCACAPVYTVTELSQILRLDGLQTLDLSRNRMTSIPDGIRNMTSLKFLAFTSNKVTQLPLCLGDMQTLTKLRLDDNPITFPPPEEYTPSEEIQKRPGFEANQYVCAQVKRVLRSTSMRERQKQESESDMNETNLETPRPSRRQLAGRFPVRPSKTSFESMDLFDPRSMPPPPIPQRSVARDSLTIPPIRRPGLAPLRIDAMAHRSKSENLQAGQPKVRRVGYVHRKVSGPPSANAVPKDFGTLKPNHFRNASSSQLTVNDPNGAGYLSSETVSPIEPITSRPWMPKSRLSSLPEDRRISKVTSPTIRSARLVVYSLDQLQRPVDDAIRIIKACSPKGYTTAKYYAAATNSVRSLDAQLHILTPLEEDNTKESSREVRAILKKSRECINHYCLLMTELRLHARKMVKGGEPMYLRALMMQMYTCLVEVRNACTIQESALSTPVKITRASQAVSDRTVTPTQSKPTGKRAKGAKIIAGWRDRSPGYSVSMLSASSSRTNTMTSVTAATPRSGDSFRGAPLIRSNTYQSYGTDSEEERQFERIYLSLRTTSELADQTLPNCRMDFFVRKEGAARSMQGAAARAWTIALTKCDALINALEKLKKSLQKVRINDPALRATRQFWHICDGFVRVSLIRAFHGICSR